MGVVSDCNSSLRKMPCPYHAKVETMLSLTCNGSQLVTFHRKGAKLSFRDKSIIIITILLLPIYILTLRKDFRISWNFQWASPYPGISNLEVHLQFICTFQSELPHEMLRVRSCTQLEPGTSEVCLYVPFSYMESHVTWIKSYPPSNNTVKAQCNTATEFLSLQIIKKEVLLHLHSP